MNFSRIVYRDQFVELMKEYEYEVGVEIGLGLGLNAKYLLENSNLKKLYCVENWSVRNPRRHKEETLKMLSAFGDRVEVIEGTSWEMADRFEDESLDYVYVDGDHRFEPALKDLESWYPKVRKGGFFGGHDYINTKKCKAAEAADKFFNEIGRSFNITNELNDGRVNKSFWIIK